MSEFSGTKPPVAILAGGRATRLYPLTMSIPKSLVPVAGEPFLAHQLRWLQGQGIERVVICCGYLGEQIERFAKDGHRFGLSVEYSYDGERALGTGGAIRRALTPLGDAFFVMYGDSLLSAELAPMWQRFHASQCLGLMAVHQNADQWDRSNVRVECGRVAHYEKADPMRQMTHIDYGISCFRAEAFENAPEDAAFDLSEVFKDLIARRQLACHEVQERFYEIGSFTGLYETSAMLSAENPGAQP
jgi:MurNAc alpha-1-phosphate uridylyltransferase